MPQTFTWKGTEIPCVPHTVNRGISVPGAGAKESTIDFTLDVRTSVLPSPMCGQIITFNSKSYRIATTDFDGTGAFVRLNLVDASSGK